MQIRTAGSGDLWAQKHSFQGSLTESRPSVLQRKIYNHPPITHRGMIPGLPWVPTRSDAPVPDSQPSLCICGCRTLDAKDLLPMVPKAQLSGQKGGSTTRLHSVLLYQFKEGPVLPLSSVPLCQGRQHNDWPRQGPVYLAHPPTHHQRS